MNEVIENVLSDETYTTNEERVEAIKKGLATLVIPKDKYNDLSAKLKTTESNYSTLQTEFNDFKISKMTDDEKREAELKQLEIDKKANAISRSELAVKGLLLDNGIKVTDEDVELKETLANIVSEDLDKSIKLANSFISLLFIFASFTHSFNEFTIFAVLLAIASSKSLILESTTGFLDKKSRLVTTSSILLSLIFASSTLFNSVCPSSFLTIS